MNILAHFFLSGGNKSVIAGNFLADFLRGKQIQKYSKLFKKGIDLHRAIDKFSDNHPNFKHSCRIIFPEYGHYSKVIIDVFYDHFLACNWDLYCKTPLHEYTKLFYDALLENQEFFPEKAKKIAIKAIETKWLNNYESFERLNEVFTAFEKRLKFDNNIKNAIYSLKIHYNELEKDFCFFFPEINRHIKQR